MLLANFQLIRENQISEILGRNKENYFQICKVVIFLYFGYQKHSLIHKILCRICDYASNVDCVS